MRQHGWLVLRVLSLALILLGGLAPAHGQIISDTALPKGNLWRLNVTGTPRNGEQVHLTVTTTPGSTVLFAFGTRSASESYPFGVLLIDPETIFASVVVGVEPNGLASLDLPLQRLRNDTKFVTQAAILDPSGSLSLTNSFRIVIQGDIGGDWTAATALPQSRGALSAVTFRDRIHVLGGSTAYGAEGFRSPAHYVYYPELDLWNRRANYPDSNTWGLRSTLVNGKIYALGGWPEGGRLNRVYDPATDEWSYLPEIPADFEWGHTVSAVGNQIYVIGDNGVRAYDVETREWTSRTSAPASEGALASAAMGGKIYLVGVRSILVFGIKVRYSTLSVYDPATGIWTPAAAPPEAVSAPGIAAHGDRLYVFGGSSFGLFSKANAHVQVYDPETDTWTLLKTDMPTIRSWSAAAPFGNRIFVFGGFDTAGLAINASHAVR